MPLGSITKATELRLQVLRVCKPTKLLQIATQFPTQFEGMQSVLMKVENSLPPCV